MVKDYDYCTISMNHYVGLYFIGSGSFWLHLKYNPYLSIAFFILIMYQGLDSTKCETDSTDKEGPGYGHSLGACGKTTGSVMHASAGSTAPVCMGPGGHL